MEIKMDIWYKILNIVALLLVPIVAVIVGQKLQERAKKREDKMQIFKVLMTSRELGWSQDMVWALNIIDVVFADDDAVIRQWKINNSLFNFRLVWYLIQSFNLIYSRIS